MNYKYEIDRLDVMLKLTRRAKLKEVNPEQSLFAAQERRIIEKINNYIDLWQLEQRAKRKKRKK